MPIKTHLDGSFLSFDPEAVGVMGVAYEMVRATIQCGYRNTISNEIIANKLSNLPKQVRERPRLPLRRNIELFTAARNASHVNLKFAA